MFQKYFHNLVSDKIIIICLMNSNLLSLTSFTNFQYHSKVECFKMTKIDEMCDLGVHANQIVPPSWVVKLPPKRVSAFFSFLFFFISLCNTGW